MSSLREGQKFVVLCTDTSSNVVGCSSVDRGRLVSFSQDSKHRRAKSKCWLVEEKVAALVNPRHSKG